MKYLLIIIAIILTPAVHAELPDMSGTDWWQVQNASDYTTACEGSGETCQTVGSGTYHVINLSTGERFENITVAGSPTIPTPVTSPQSSGIKLTVHDHECFGLAAEKCVFTCPNGETALPGNCQWDQWQNMGAYPKVGIGTVVNDQFHCRINGSYTPTQKINFTMQPVCMSN